MRKPFYINGIWQGETVAILGAGPDMTEELAEKARESRLRPAKRTIGFLGN